MDGTFTSGALLAGSAGGPPSNPYSTPITEAAHSPAPHKAPTQGWLLTGPSSAPGSAHMAHASVPSPTASGYADPSKPITSAESPSHPSNYASAQNYQAIVDEIMNQTRKGTDYGLDLGDFEMLDTLGDCPTNSTMPALFLTYYIFLQGLVLSGESSWSGCIRGLLPLQASVLACRITLR